MSTTSHTRVRRAPRPIRLSRPSSRVRRHPAYQKPQKVSPPEPTPTPRSESDSESVFSFTTDSLPSRDRRGEPTIINIHCCPEKKVPLDRRGGGCGNNGNWPAFNGCNGYNGANGCCNNWWGPNIGCPSFDTLGYPYWPVYSPPTWVSPSPLTQPWNAGPIGCGNNGVSTIVPYPAPPGFCPTQLPPFTSNLLSLNNNCNANY